MNSKFIAFFGLFAILFGCVLCSVEEGEYDTISLRVFGGSNRWWLAIDPINDRYETVDIEVREAGTLRWAHATYNPSNKYFQLPSETARGFKFPLTFRFTAANGERVATSAFMQKITPDTVLETGVQYNLVEAPTEEPTETPTAPPEVPTAVPTKAPTQLPTKAPTKAPSTQAPTQPPTKAPTQPPTQAPTKVPTQPPTQAPTLPPTKAPTQPPTQAPTKTPTQAPTQLPTKAPTQPPTQAPTRPPTQAPTQPPTQAPTQPPTQVPTQPPTQAPTLPPTQAPTQPPTQAPTQPPTQAPTQPPTQAPTRPPTQAPTQPPTKAPTQPPAVDLCAVTSPRSEPVKIMVPLYVYPGAAWDELVASANSGVKIIAVINPNSGPNYNGPDNAYKTYIKKLVDAGIEVVGYVHTEWGARDINTVTNEVNIYATKYAGVQGIFFDEAATGVAQIPYYRRAYDAVVAQGFIESILNPGAQPDLGYLAISTNIVIFEDYAYSLWAKTYSSWATCAPNAAAKPNYKYKFTAIIHTASLSDVPALIAKSHDLGMGIVYITDGPGGCCTYNYLANYFAQESAAVKTYNS